MDKYIEVLKKDKYDSKVIELVKRTILIAEEWISTPRSTKINAEVVKEANNIFKG